MKHERDRVNRGAPEEGVIQEMDEEAWLSKMKKRVEEEMTKKEIEMISYWRGEIEKILAKKHEGLGSLQIEMQQFLQRMQNRIKVLKQTRGN
jgi:archaellum component FlaC